MNQIKKKILSAEDARELLTNFGDEYVLIENPNYIFAPYDICPLAPKIKEPREKIMAVVQDMDGTTTTTEALCLHSLEHMTRCYTGRMDENKWQGLDRVKDYPHIIGNSTTKHVEYLLRTYGDYYNEKFFKVEFLKASLITLAFGRDVSRKRETEITLRYFGLADILQDEEIQQWFEQAKSSAKIFLPENIERKINAVSQKFSIRSFSDQVRAAIEVYYQRYHEILFKIENNDTKDLSELVPKGHAHFIEPMPGAAIFLAAIKGWLGEDLGEVSENLIVFLSKSVSAHDGKIKPVMAKIGKFFQQHPVKSAVVTSSILYEADIVLGQVFRVMQEEVESWNISENKKQMIIDKFSDYRNVFNEVITASDSSEIRLKPHRDLYSLALHRLGIDKANYCNVIGFEDSESGVIAIRAAGIGLCVAVPFADTQGHDLSPASFILKNGLPEAMVVHNFFLKI